MHSRSNFGQNAFQLISFSTRCATVRKKCKMKVCIIEVSHMLGRKCTIKWKKTKDLWIWLQSCTNLAQIIMYIHLLLSKKYDEVASNYILSQLEPLRNYSLNEITKVLGGHLYLQNVVLFTAKTEKFRFNMLYRNQNSK